jgi:uncharacterized membrane protein
MVILYSFDKREEKQMITNQIEAAREAAKKAAIRKEEIAANKKRRERKQKIAKILFAIIGFIVMECLFTAILAYGFMYGSIYHI